MARVINTAVISPKESALTFASQPPSANTAARAPSSPTDRPDQYCQHTKVCVCVCFAPPRQDLGVELSIWGVSELEETRNMKTSDGRHNASQCW